VAIQNTLGFTKIKVKAIGNTEKIDKPKVLLEKIIKNRMKKPYLNTVHNQKIAKNIKINNLMGCSSFRPLYDFLYN
jgi:hypothetical protein